MWLTHKYNNDNIHLSMYILKYFNQIAAIEALCCFWTDGEEKKLCRQKSEKNEGDPHHFQSHRILSLTKEKTKKNQQQRKSLKYFDLNERHFFSRCDLNSFKCEMQILVFF